MELDYLAMYACLVALLALSLSLAAIPEPISNLGELLTTIAVAARHPGTVVRVSLYLPESCVVTLDGDRITVSGAALPASVVAIYRKWGLGIHESNALSLNFRVNRLEFSSGLYLLEVSSIPGRVTVKILNYRPLSGF